MSGATSAETVDTPFEFLAPLSVCLDVRHANAYLALQPVRALAAELGTAVDWLPFPVSPPKGPPAQADDRGARHRRAMAEHQAREVAVYARLQGLTIEQPFRRGDAAPAALGHLWLRATSPEAVPDYLARLFEGYWSLSLDVADPVAIARLLGALGHDADAFAAFAAGTGPTDLARLRRRLVAAGVFTVPSLVVKDEVFVGRAHLPMVRWLLNDRQGPLPI
jgi:2-hydroxychromene-2-carboxylate isomerase